MRIYTGIPIVATAEEEGRYSLCGRCISCWGRRPQIHSSGEQSYAELPFLQQCAQRVHADDATVIFSIRFLLLVICWTESLRSFRSTQRIHPGNSKLEKVREVDHIYKSGRNRECREGRRREGDRVKVHFRVQTLELPIQYLAAIKMVTT